jgi:deoxyribodipyrimidine photolyase
MTDINNLTAQQYYDKMTSYAAIYIKSVSALESLRASFPEKRISLPASTISNANELALYFEAYDDLVAKTDAWHKEYHRVETERDSAMRNLRDMITDELKGIWMKIDLGEDGVWGIQKAWSPQGHYIKSFQWSDVEALSKETPDE